MIDLLNASVRLSPAAFSAVIDNMQRLSAAKGHKYGHRAGNDYHWLRTGPPKRCPVTLRLSEKDYSATLWKFCPPIFLHGHNAQLLDELILAAIIEAVGGIAAGYGLPDIHDWRVTRVDYAHDFHVRPEHVPRYLDALRLRDTYKRGHHLHPYEYTDAAQRDPNSVYWHSERRDYYEIIVYDKHAENSKASPGTLRFEVRLKNRGCQGWAKRLAKDGLGEPSLLTVETAMRGEVGRRVVLTVYNQLNLGVPLYCDDEVRRRIKEACRTDGMTAFVFEVHRLRQIREKKREDIAIQLQTTTRKVADAFRLLRRLGIEPGIQKALPGLALYGGLFDEETPDLVPEHSTTNE